MFSILVFNLHSCCAKWKIVFLDLFISEYLLKVISGGGGGGVDDDYHMLRFTVRSKADRSQLSLAHEEVNPIS